jgi:hypothetical protein
MFRIFFILALLMTQVVNGQIWMGPTLGVNGYIGDLNDKPFKRVKPAIGITGAYELTPRINLRAGLSLGKIEGGDEWSGTTFLKQNRNLSFANSLSELSLVAEFTVFNLDKIRWSPYIFGGVALFHFNPYVKDSGQKVYLKPLATEGQGFAEYPNRKTYSLTQASLPFGGGLKYVLNDNAVLRFETGIRKTSTDYLDDVSTTYIYEATLLQRSGPVAVRLSYRGDEVAGSNGEYPDNGYPAKDAIRGGVKFKDWYYFTGFHLLFRLNSGIKKSGSKRGYDCPKVPM